MKKIILILSFCLASQNVWAQGFGFQQDAQNRLGCSVKYGEVGPYFARMHDEIGVMAEQEQAWKIFSAKMQNALAPLANLCGIKTLFFNEFAERMRADARKTLPERLLNAKNRLDLQARVVGAVEEAVKEVYPALDDQQKIRLEQSSRQILGY